MIALLQGEGIDVAVADPMADPHEVERHYGITLTDLSGSGYDAVIVAVAHDGYRTLDAAWFASRLRRGGVLADLKGIFRHLAEGTGGLRYWSL